MTSRRNLSEYLNLARDKLVSSINASNASIESTRAFLTGPVQRYLEDEDDMTQDAASKEGIYQAEESEELSKTPESKEKCLLNSSLSFADNFDTISGIPTYLLRHSDMDAVGENVRGKPPSRSRRLNRPFLRREGSFGRKLSPETSTGHETKAPLITTYAISHDGNLLAVSYESGEVLIWNTNNGSLVYDLELDANDGILCLSFSRSVPNRVLIATKQQNCILWDLDKRDNSQDRFGSGSTDLYLHHHHYYSYQDKTERHREIHCERALFADDGEKLLFARYESSSPDREVIFELFDVGESPLSVKSHFEVFVDENDAVSELTFSPSRQSLLVGFINEKAITGSSKLWPDVGRYQHEYWTFPHGALATWSSSGKYVVTWTFPCNPVTHEGETNCAFVYDIEKARETMQWGNVNLKDHMRVFTSPHELCIVWCRCVQDMEKKDRLITCVVGQSSRFLFWDMETKSVTSSVRLNDGITESLKDLETWLHAWRIRRKSKDISSISLSGDRTQIGIVSRTQKCASIWSALFGMQTVEISYKDFVVDGSDSNDPMVMLFSPSNEKFALIGCSNVILFVPPANAYKSHPDILKAQAVELEHSKDKCRTDSKFKMEFSRDGKSLGLLHINATSLCIWHLIQGSECLVNAVDSGTTTEIRDFCLSPYGNYALLSTVNCKLLLFDCKGKTGIFLHQINIKSVSVAMKMFDDSLDTMLCHEDGSIACYCVLLYCDPYRTDQGSSMLQGTWLGDLERPFRAFLSWNRRSSGETERRLVEKEQDIEDAAANKDVKDDMIPPNSARIRYQTTIREGKERVKRCRFSENGETAVLQYESGQLAFCHVSKSGKRNEQRLEADHPYSKWIRNVLPSPDALQTLTEINGNDPTLPNAQNLVRFRLPIVFSDNAKFIVAAHKHVNEFKEAWEEHLSSSITKEINHASTIYVMHLQCNEEPTQLNGHCLMPEKGLIISPDNRHIACISGKGATHVTVWTPYASNHVVPDLYSLSLRYEFDDKETMRKMVDEQLEKFGINFFNCLHSCGNSLLHQAITNGKKHILRSLINHVRDKKMKISFFIRQKQDTTELEHQYKDLVEICLNQKSLECLSIIVNALLDGSTHTDELVHLLCKHSVTLYKKHSDIFSHFIGSTKLLIQGHGKVKVPESKLKRKEFLTLTIPSMNLSSEQIARLWKRKYEHSNTDSYLVPTAVPTFIIPIKNACQIGEQGFLRHLLLNGTVQDCYKSFVIKAIVEHKWRSYAKSITMQDFMSHIVICVVFTLYSFFLEDEETYKLSDGKGSEENSIRIKITLTLSSVLTIPFLCRELLQCYTYWSAHGHPGFVFWLRSSWNWVEVLSYLNIIFVIPLSHFWLFNTGHRTIVLSSLVAFESLILWSRIFFYARPFKTSGRLVNVLFAMLTEVLPLLFFALCVIFGYAIAFHVLYRHSPVGSLEEEDEECKETEEDCIHRRPSPARFMRTLFAMFGFIFGNLEMKTFFHAPDPLSATILFVTYMIFITVLLWNAFIAMMGHTFSRNVERENASLIYQRALAIDDVDSMLSEKKKKQLNAQMGAFLQVTLWPECQVVKEMEKLKEEEEKKTKRPFNG